jgi:predicted N-acyltransferase
MIAVRIFHSIENVNKEEWDSIIPKNETFKKYDILRIIQNSHLDECRFFYLLFSDQDTLIASATLFVMKFNLDILAPDSFKNATNYIRKFYPAFLTTHLLGCGPALSICSDSITVINYTYYSKVLNEINNYMKSIALTEKCSLLLYKEIKYTKAGYFRCLFSSGFSELPSLPNAILNIRWSSFDEYMASLRAKYRAKVNREIAKINADKIEITREQNCAFLAEKLWSLYLNVYEKSSFKFERLSRTFFEKILSDTCSTIVLFRNKEIIIGFVLLMEEGSTLKPLCIGLDYSISYEYDIYFNMLYEIIKIAIDRGKTSIEFGQTSYFPKLRVGACLENLSLFVRIRRHFPNMIMKKILPKLIEKQSYQNLRVFKNCDGEINAN